MHALIQSISVGELITNVTVLKQLIELKQEYFLRMR